MKFILSLLACLLFSNAYSVDFDLPDNYFIARNQPLGSAWDNTILYVADVNGMTACFTPNGVYFSKQNVSNSVLFTQKLALKKNDPSAFPMAILFDKAQTLLVDGGQPISYPLNVFDVNEQVTQKFQLYKTICYKNVYPNIDAVFTLPEEGGLKYEFVLHKGANIADIQVVYDGAEKVELATNNDLMVSGNHMDLLEKNLIAYYQYSKNPLGVNYVINNANTIGFKTDADSNDYPIVIDPWVVAPNLNSMPNTIACPVAIEYDNANNLYVLYAKSFVNSPNFTPASSLVKYNQAGVVQWIYDFSTIPYFSGQGDVAVNPANGDSYITGGDVASGGFTPLLLRVNTNGVLLATPNSQFDFEANTCFYNHCTNRVYTGVSGNLTQPSSHIMVYNPANASANFVNCGFPLGENVMLAQDPDGSSFYSATFNPPPSPNQGAPETLRISKILYSNMGSEAWSQSASGLTLIAELSPTYLGGTNDAFKGLTASLDFLYGYDGNKIVRFNKITGAVLNTISTGLTVGTTSGIVTDNCGRVYVGVGNAVRIYNPDLSFISEITTTGNCHDLTIIDDQLYVCGGGGAGENSNGFVSEFDITTITQEFSLAITHSTCVNCSGTAAITVTGCNEPEDYTYSWTNLSSQDPSVTELCDGVYTVYVLLGCDTLFQETFEILESQSSLSIDLGADTTICSESAVLNPGVAGMQYAWNTNENTQEITVTSSGEYWVNVTDSLGCTVSDTIHLMLNEILVNLGEDTVLCDFVNLTLDAGWQNAIYSWQDNSNNQFYQAVSPGVYWVTVDSSGCIGSDTILIQLVQTPTISLTWTDICLGDTAQITAQGAESYSWSQQNEILQQNLNSILTSPELTTEFQVIGSTQGCADTLVALLTVFPLPDLLFSGETVICKGDSTTIEVSGAIEYSWNPTPDISNTNGNNVTLFPDQTATYNVEGTDENGCISSELLTISIEEVLISVNDLTLCGMNDSGELLATGADTYNWSPNTELSSTTISNPEVSVDETTIYQVIGQSVLGCLDTAYATVTVVPDFEITVNSDSICAGESALLTANGADSYTWSPFIGLNVATGPEVLAAPVNTTIYTVTGFVSGCSESAQSIVTVIPLTNVSIYATPNPVSTLEPTVSFSTDPGNDSQTWYIENTSVSHEFSFTHDMPQIAGEYLVVLETQNILGCTSLDSMIITVVDDIAIYIPNSFTPDGDQFNPVFIPILSGEVDDSFGYEFIIFNRWGEEVFKTTELMTGWDGTYKGLRAPDGTYTWTIQFKAKYNGKMFQKNGHVTLLR